MYKHFQVNNLTFEEVTEIGKALGLCWNATPDPREYHWGPSYNDTELDLGMQPVFFVGEYEAWLGFLVGYAAARGLVEFDVKNNPDARLSPYIAIPEWLLYRADAACRE